MPQHVSEWNAPEHNRPRTPEKDFGIEKIESALTAWEETKREYRLGDSRD